MGFKLNTESAKQADRTTSNINTAGKYIGVITRAEKIISKNNVEGIGLSFKADNGSTANYLDLYLKKPDGTELPSISTLNAIMACTRTRELTDGAITVTKWDKETQKEYEKQVEGYPELMDKRIGLLLREELSTYNNEDKSRVIISGVFSADDELTASEVLDGKTQPEQLERMVDWLMKNPIYDRRASKPQQASGSSGQAFDNFEDSIPF